MKTEIFWEGILNFVRMEEKNKDMEENQKIFKKSMIKIDFVRLHKIG